MAHLAVLGAAGALVALLLAFFAIRAWHVLGFSYPLDYGEGPLLAQVEQLRGGTPLWRLYGDFGAPPYLVVNYPPVYLLAASGVAALLDLIPHGNANPALLAGRLISLFATLGSAVALWRLAQPASASRGAPWTARAAMLVVTLAFLGIPVVREWAAFMRVDLLGVCLGLWGIVLARRGSRWAALPLALSLLVKPSLIAAPAAALAWLWFRDRRRALEITLVLAAIGGAVAGALQWASGGWFWRHVVTANANPWSPALAEAFWQDQYAILWPLWLAAALAGLLLLARAWRIPPNSSGAPDRSYGAANYLLPIYYAGFGAFVAFGIGKVGAYANYFFELYAGMIWLVGAALAALHHLTHAPRKTQATANSTQRGARGAQFATLGSALLLGLVAAALLRYYPLWSENFVKPYGLIEGENPARLTLGSYGVWRDLQREREILATLDRVNHALVDRVQAFNQPIFSDFPAIAAQAGALSRLQAFEHRQVYDIGLWDQRPLLRDLANGRVPLVVLDYLGNWLTPEMISLITHRYAQEGSRGTFDLYRPIDPGAFSARTLDLGAGLRMSGFFLRPAIDGVYDPGERLLLTLELSAATTSQCDATPCNVVVRLTTSDGIPLVAWERPLLYGALPPAAWGDTTVQHMQPLDLPPELPPGAYRLTIAIRAGDDELAAAQALTDLTVGETRGRLLGERGYFVPAPLFAAWLADGGYDGPGDPLMPAVPFDDGVLQCFMRACYRYLDGAVERLPLGELILLGESGLRPAIGAAPARMFAETGHGMSGTFLEAWELYGGEAALGPPITGELQRGDRRVQYTRYGRLEQIGEGKSVRAANLGEDYMRLPGIPYRWP